MRPADLTEEEIAIYAELADFFFTYAPQFNEGREHQRLALRIAKVLRALGGTDASPAPEIEQMQAVHRAARRGSLL